MDGTPTGKLARFISELEFERLPGDVVAHVKLLVLDTIGAGLLGSRMPWSVRLRSTFEDMESPGDALVWGSDQRYSAPSAALINGTAVHGFEIDDVGAGGHNGSVTLTSILALRRHADNISGQDLITALVAGIEAGARVGNCVGSVPHVGMGFHGPGLMGTFASVGSASRALRLDASQCKDAVGHAAQQAASLMFTHHGGMGKRMLAGQAARAGTFSALLAVHGFTNAHNPFEAEYGSFPAAHTGNQKPPVYNLGELTEGLGEEWQSRDVTFKMWACRAPNHGTLEAIRRLRREHTLSPDQVASVELRLGTGFYQNVGWRYDPTTITSAQLNISYVTAMMLLEDDVFVDQFTRGKISSPVVMEMVSRISVIHDSAVDDSNGTPVKITMKNGTVLEALGRPRRGATDDPVTADDVRRKFRKMTRDILTDRKADRAIALCESLESLTSLDELSSVLEIDGLAPLEMGSD